MTKIGVGDLVVAVNGGLHKEGTPIPMDTPVNGKIYRISAVFAVLDGLGCSLEAMNPSPYMGYYLMRKGKYYFRKVQKADDEFQQMLKKIKPAVKELVHEI